MPIKIFFCYAREDELFLKRLSKHLKLLQRQGLIEMWHDRDISAGAEWEREIDKHLNTAQIILLLVSPDFMDSEYCYSIEMKRALERHKRGEAQVIPIILCPVYWGGEPLGKLQALPTDAKPVESWPTIDAALFDVAEGIRKLAEKLVETQRSEKKDERLNQNITFHINEHKVLAAEVALTYHVEKEYMPVTSERQLAYILLEVKPTDLMVQVRMPLNFCLVIDHSSSMRGEKLHHVKEAMKMLIDHLEPSDYISLVIFDHTAQVIIPSIPANDSLTMKAAIDRIRESDNKRRYMSLGMSQGLDELRRWNIPNSVSRMILLTDGVTDGDSDRCRQVARDAAQAGIAIYPLGIGADWDEDLLDDLGQLSGGMPAEFIRRPTDAVTVFQQQTQSAVEIAVRDVMLTLHLPNTVNPMKAAKVLPVINPIAVSSLSRQIAIPLGDLDKDTPQSVLIELAINRSVAGLTRIAQAELTYDLPIVGLINEKIKADITINFTNDIHLTMIVNPLVKDFVEKMNSFTIN